MFSSDCKYATMQYGQCRNQMSHTDTGNGQPHTIVNNCQEKYSQAASIHPSQILPIIAPTGNNPVACTCPYCRHPIVTRVEKTNGLAVWLSAVGICLVGCVLGCCIIPFFLDRFKDITHYCPNCNAMLRQIKRF